MSEKQFTIIGQEYYTSEVLFKSDVDPNRAVKEVINEILNAPIYEE